MKARVRRALRTVLRAGHQVQLLQGAEELLPSMRAAMAVAAREIRMETYIFWTDPAAEQMLQALIDAARRGVAVYLTMDGIGTPSLPGTWQGQMDAAGVQWHIYKPAGPVTMMFPSRWRRLHRKLCVIDGEVAFCGGVNVLDDWNDPNHGVLKAPRLDFAVRVQGPLVSAAHEVMARAWWRHQAASTAREADWQAAWAALQKAVPPESAGIPEQQTARGGVRAALLLRDNVRHRRRIEMAYLRAISLARHEVIIANAYFLPGRKLRLALMDAVRRGVRVRLLLQGRYEYFLQYHAVRPVYGPLMEAGVEIHEYSPSFLHAKVAVIDGHWSTVGSSNLDPLSLLLAREANVVIDDRAFAGDLRGRLLHAIAHEGKPIDPHAYANRPWSQRLLDRVAFALTRLALFLLGRRY